MLARVFFPHNNHRRTHATNATTTHESEKAKEMAKGNDMFVYAGCIVGSSRERALSRASMPPNATTTRPMLKWHDGAAGSWVERTRIKKPIIIGVVLLGWYMHDRINILHSIAYI